MKKNAVGGENIAEHWWILVVRMLRVIKMRIRMRMMRMLGVNPLQQRNGCSGCRLPRLVQTNIKCNFNFCVIWNLKFSCATVQCDFFYLYVKFEKLCTIVHLKICLDLHQIPFFSAIYFFPAQNKSKCTWDIQIMSNDPIIIKIIKKRCDPKQKEILFISSVSCFSS